jgi:hypothetical protein
MHWQTKITGLPQLCLLKTGLLQTGLLQIGLLHQERLNTGAAE